MKTIPSPPNSPTLSAHPAFHFTAKQGVTGILLWQYNGNVSPNIWLLKKHSQCCGKWIGIKLCWMSSRNLLQSIHFSICLAPVHKYNLLGRVFAGFLKRKSPVHATDPSDVGQESSQVHADCGYLLKIEQQDWKQCTREAWPLLDRPYGQQCGLFMLVLLMLSVRTTATLDCLIFSVQR